MKKSRKRIVLFIITFFFLIGIICGAVYLKNVADYKKAVKATVN